MIGQSRTRILGSNDSHEWLKSVPRKPAEAGWNVVEIAGFHQLKVVANRESAKAD